MIDIQDEDYGLFYDIEEICKKDDNPIQSQQQIFHKQKDKNLDEILYKGANYFIGVVTFCITVVSFYEIFS